jgi:hypothetical protein
MLSPLLGLALSLAFAPPAFAKQFKNQFVSLELPPNWDCKQEEIDWVCQPDNLAERSEAILVIVTKLANETDDTLDQYEAILKETRPMRDLLGNAYQSQVKYMRRRDLHGHPWVDSLHLGSEVPGFYTRYVASLKEKVAALITYSVAESVYPKYAGALDQMIDSAEIFFDPKAFNDAMKSRPGSLLGPKGTPNSRFAPVLKDEKADASSGDSKTDMGQIIGGAIMVGAVGFYLWKKKQQRGG